MSVADESLKLDEKTENILADAFNLLIDNEKKISEAISRSKKGSIEEAEEIEEVSEANREPKKLPSGQAVTINEVTKSVSYYLSSTFNYYLLVHSHRLFKYPPVTYLLSSEIQFETLTGV